MEFVVTLLVAFAFGAAAKKKGREGLKWGAGLAAVLFTGVSAIGFYGQAARLSGPAIDPMATWYWLIVVCAAAAIYLYSLDGKVTPTTPAASVHPAEFELQTHRVVLEGRALEGQEIAQVATRLGQLFKRPTEQLVSLLQGKPTVLKRGLDEATARRYQAAVQQAGAACRVEREQPAVDASVPSAGERSAASAEKPVQRSAWGNIKHYGAIGVGLVVLASGLWQFGSKMMGSAPVGDAPDSVKIASPATKADAPKVATLPPKQSAVPDDYATLLDAATRYITEWNTDPNTRLCDEIASPGLTDVQKGKVIFITMGGGKVDPPIPAIVARMTGTCVQAAMRQREPMPRVWMMMAHDKAFNQYRCIKVGGDDLVRNFASKGCEFVPNPGESGLIQVQAASSEQPTPAGAADTPQSGAMPTLAKGESYTSVRLKMLGAGWKPYRAKDADTCSEGDMRCKDRPEMESCAGTGMASCTFLWTRNDKFIAVVTTGEEEAVFAGLQDRSQPPAGATQPAPSTTPPSSQQAAPTGSAKSSDKLAVRMLSCELRVGKVETMDSIVYFGDGTFVEISYIISNNKVFPTLIMAGVYSRTGNEYRRTRRGSFSIVPGKPSRWEPLPNVEIVDEIRATSIKRAFVKTKTTSVNGVKQDNDYGSAVFNRDCQSEDDDPEQLRRMENARRRIPPEYFSR